MRLRNKTAADNIMTKDSKWLLHTVCPYANTVALNPSKQLDTNASIHLS